MFSYLCVPFNTQNLFDEICTSWYQNLRTGAVQKFRARFRRWDKSSEIMMQTLEMRETLGQGYCAAFSCEVGNSSAPAGPERLARLLCCALLLDDPRRFLSREEEGESEQRQKEWELSAFACHRMREVREQPYMRSASMPVGGVGHDAPWHPSAYAGRCHKK
jgi:hypothetical protein